jgi:polyhydroxyalkanoate synthesis regulator phasin
MEELMTGDTETQKQYIEINREKLIELSRKILLAGLGAAALAQEEIERFIQLLVERGELAEKDAREMMREILDRREQMMRERKRESPAAPAAASKADIEALTAKINELNKKIEELRKQK